MSDRSLKRKADSSSKSFDMEAGNVKYKYEKVLAVRDYIHKKRFRHSNSQQGWILYRKNLVAEARLGDETATSLMLPGLEKPHIVQKFYMRVPCDLFLALIRAPSTTPAYGMPSKIGISLPFSLNVVF